MNRNMNEYSNKQMTLPFSGRIWLRHIQKYRLPIFLEIIKYVNLSGIVLEIGSGSSWFSSNISKIPAVKKISAIDIDPKRIEAAKIFGNFFNADKTKLSFVIGDFHSIPAENETLDFCVCDASLHHSQDLPKVLKEICRALKPNGTLIAIREPILPSFFLLRIYRKFSFGLLQKLRGDIENTYTLTEWQKIFNESGFSLELRPYYLNTTVKEKLIKFLSKYNGMLFNRYILIAKKI